MREYVVRISFNDSESVVLPGPKLFLKHFRGIILTMFLQRLTAGLHQLVSTLTPLSPTLTHRLEPWLSTSAQTTSIRSLIQVCLEGLASWMDNGLAPSLPAPVSSSTFLGLVSQIFLASAWPSRAHTRLQNTKSL